MNAAGRSWKLSNLLWRIRRVSLLRWFLIVQVAGVMVLVHLGIRLVPFSKLMRYLRPFLTVSPGKSYRAPVVEGVCWAVPRLGRILLGRDNCLTLAVTGQIVLASHGYPTELRIGVQKQDDNSLLAHAWLENNSTVLIGGEDDPSLSRYQRLPKINFPHGVSREA